MTEAPPGRRTGFRRGLAILLAWHVLLAGVLMVLAYEGFVNDDDCVAHECLLSGDRGLALWLAPIAGIPALVSLILSVPALAVLVLRARWSPVMAAGVCAFGGLFVTCLGGLVVLAFDSS